jgi:predicted phage terminase large subunit-like protein
MLNIKWSKYIPPDKKPTSKQLAFMSLPHMEALFGGSASGGKSEALLMLALAWCDTPGYKGLIVRQTYTDMLLPSSILNRCLKWLKPFLQSKEVKYDANQHTFTFPGGAELAFGYLKASGTQYRYQSSEYNQIFFDELTQFQLDEYLYLFSRLRKPQGCQIPLILRSGSNPGGSGGYWVKERFKIQKDEETGEWYGGNPDAPFVPARLADNPHVDQQYAQALDKLGKVERERLKNGDWDVAENSIFDNYWFMNRYLTKTRGLDVWYHLPSYEGRDVVHMNDMMIFTTVDTAASVKTGVKGVSFTDNRQASWSVISTWGLTPKFDLLWLDCWRAQTTIPDLCNRIYTNHKMWKPLYNIIEKNGPGEGVAQWTEAKGLPVKPIHQSRDKIINSTAAQLRAEKGKIWLPAFKPWLKTVENELFAWTGAVVEPDDIVDTLSNAANEAMELSEGFERDYELRKGLKRAIPASSGGANYRTNQRPGARESILYLSGKFGKGFSKGLF